MAGFLHNLLNNSSARQGAPQQQDKSMRNIGQRADGFTLLELLISLAVATIVMTGLYSLYDTHRRSYHTQAQIVEMQQNLRAGMLLMVNEIREAGYDPTGGAGAGFVTIAADEVNFTMDLDGDGAVTGAGENISYCLNTVDGVQKLARKSPATPQPVVENIDALNFVYLDRDGNVTADAADVRSVQVSMVAKTEKPALDQYVNNTVYTNLRGETLYDAGGDTYRRQVFSTHVKCRNTGP
jgi:type IV pilus assembly protein PilW